MTIYCDDSSAKKIVERALEKPICEPFRGLLIRNNNHAIIGAIVFNNYEGSNVYFTCVMSGGPRGSISMKDARYVARYVFKQLGCRRCTAITSELNMAARRALLQLGFKFEGRLREHFDEADGLVYGILRSEQKIARI